MADQPSITDSARWETALAAYRDARQTVASGPGLLDGLAAIDERASALMALPAPHFAAVAQKLAILWETDLLKPDQDGAEKRRLMQDLDDLLTRGSARATSLAALLGRAPTAA